MLHIAVSASIILGFLSAEFLGLLSGGLVSAGYLAFFMEQPFRLMSTIILAILVCLLVRFLQRYLIIYGRRRFVLTVLISMVLAAAIEKSFFYVSTIGQDLRVIGYIIPGLIANDMEKQGIFKTLLALIVITGSVWLLIHSGLV